VQVQYYYAQSIYVGHSKSSRNSSPNRSFRSNLTRRPNI